MANIITEAGHGLSVVATDTVHVVEKVADALPHAAAVLADALKNEPAIKAAVLSLIAKGATVVGDVTLAVAEKGTNLAQDAGTVADAESFVDYFKSTFIPAVAALYSEVKADISASAAS